MSDSAPLKTAIRRGTEIADQMAGNRSECETSKGESEIASKLRQSGEVIQERIHQGAEEFPLMMGMGFLALGFLIGLAVPHSKKEDRVLGTLADQVKKRGLETGKEVMEASGNAARRAIQPLKKSNGHGPDSGISF